MSVWERVAQEEQRILSRLSTEHGVGHQAQSHDPAIITSAKPRVEGLTDSGTQAPRELWYLINHIILSILHF